MGCRYPARWGGRDLDWISTAMVMEEVGVLGYIFACTLGVGAELVCDAIVLHGTDAQKEKYVAPLLRGELFAAECLTEPRRANRTLKGKRSTSKASSSPSRVHRPWPCVLAHVVLEHTAESI